MGHFEQTLAILFSIPHTSTHVLRCIISKINQTHIHHTTSTLIKNVVKCQLPLFQPSSNKTNGKKLLKEDCCKDTVKLLMPRWGDFTDLRQLVQVTHGLQSSANLIEILLVNSCKGGRCGARSVKVNVLPFAVFSQPDSSFFGLLRVGHSSPKRFQKLKNLNINPSAHAQTMLTIESFTSETN